MFSRLISFAFFNGQPYLSKVLCGWLDLKAAPNYYRDRGFHQRWVGCDRNAAV